jgi:UDP-N-acetylmuramoyl-tripeptide--D-alanyl-D-alanine ligase
MKIINIIFPFRDFIYLLQQEEYSISRLNFWFWRFFFKRNIERRDTLKFTKRTKMTFAISVLVWLLSMIIILTISEHFFKLLFGIVNIILIPVYIILVNLILSPIYQTIKSNVVKRATKFLNERRDGLKIIAITGSYGKTTIKNFIYQLLKYNYKTVMVPRSINSAVSISDWILDNLKYGNEILITEIDSYKKGRIKTATEFLDPDISIITNVGDQHLEKFGSKKDLADSLYELFQYSKEGCIKISNQVTVDYLKSVNKKTDDIKIVNETSINNLSKSNNENYSLALSVAKHFNINQKYIDYISERLVLPDRRQKQSNMFGFEAIDDSYNISLETATQSIIEAKRLSDLKSKKLLVISAGIPELSEENKDSNIKLGKLLDQTADKIILLKSVLYKDVEKGISNKEKIIYFDTFREATANLEKHFDPKEHFLLVEPELNDIYY